MQKISATICLATYNLYIGGSLVISDAISDLIDKDEKFFRFNPVYPSKFFNFIWRIFLDQIIVPLLSLKANKLVMFGNVPSIFFVGDQKVFFHNPNYLRKDWRYQSIRNYLEYLYFYFCNKVCLKFRRIEYFVQIQEIKENLNKFLGPVPIKVIGSPLKKKIPNKKLKSSDDVVTKCVMSGKFFFFPAYFYENKNHILLSKTAKKIKDIYDINIVCSNTNGLKNLIEIKAKNKNELYYCIKKSIGVIFPSLHETFGYPLIEAAKMNKPILAINKKYTHNVIKNFYFFDNSQKSLLKTIQKFKIDQSKNKILIPKLNVQTSPNIFIKNLIKNF